MPFIRRRPLLRAAVVGGGAYAIGEHSANQQAERQEEAYNAGARTRCSGAAPASPPLSLRRAPDRPTATSPA